MQKIDENKLKINRYLPKDNIIAIFDDSDMVKIYGKKFEDLDEVIDGSDPKKKIKPWYHICNACLISKNQKQPKEFKSMNNVTNESIEEVTKIVGEKFIGIFDRRYDDEKIFRLLNKQGTKFIIRLTSKRKMLFKGKKKNILDVANGRKGKYKMNVIRKNKENQELYVSYTRVNMIDKEQEEFTIVFVYGLGKEPMMLITNIDVKDGNDAITIVRMYIDRWKIEEIHRAEKTEYHYEDMRVRSLVQLNNLNFIFMLTLFFICIQIEKMDSNLFSIEILLRSKSLKEQLTVWISQYANGMRNIIEHSQSGIQNFKKRKIKTSVSKEIEKENIIIYEQLSIFEKM